MRIGTYLYKVQFGGGEKRLIFLCKELAGKGHEIVIFTADEAIKNIKLPFTIILFKKDSNKITRYKIIRQNIRRKRLDWFLMFYPQDFVLAAALLTKTPILSFLCVDCQFYAKNILRKMIQSFWLGCSKKVVFQTERLRETMPRYIRQKSVVIPNPIMIEYCKSSYTIEKRHVVSSVGRLADGKGFDFLIDSFSKACEGNDYVLHIYGDGPLKGKLQQQINDLHLDSRVFLDGYSDNVPQAICSSEIFVLGSKSEGMPNALIEAMAMGLACISTKFNSGASEYLIQDGQNGLLVDYGDVGQMANCIRYLIENKEQRRDMQQAALEIWNKLGKEKIVKEWENSLK